MARKTIYNNITSPEKIVKINKKNTELMNDFLEYLSSVGRAQTTIKAYKSDLAIFFCWCLDNIDNKYFVDLTKRELSKFQNHALNVWGWSPNRLRSVKAALSSLSNFIENVLDDEVKNFKKITNRIESPPKEAVREKTVLSEEDVEKLLSTLLEKDDVEKATFFALAAYSGRRKSELCRFRLSDVSEENLVCNGALYKTAPIRTKGRGTNGKQLECYVLAKKFRPYLEKWLEYREKNGIESEWLFFAKGKSNEQLRTSTVDSWATSVSQMIKMSVYPHSFRHFFTTSLSQAGLPDPIIQSILGWTSVAMVQVYNDVKAEDKLSEFFSADGEIVVSKQKSISEI